MRKFQQHRSIDKFVVHLFRLDLHEDLLAQSIDILHKFLSQLTIMKRLQHLQFLFLFVRTDHSEAISFFEKETD